MKFAIVKIGKSQYKVSEGDTLQVDYQKKADKPLAKDDKIDFDKVLLFEEDGKAQFGKPYLKDFFVACQVLGVSKGEKVRVATYKAKSRYRRVIGFRPIYTDLKVLKISEVSQPKASKKK
jgi:large subunit ribosomal protein L21